MVYYFKMVTPVPGSSIFLFDVDGTLTPSRNPMTPEFREFMNSFMENHNVGIVGGSNMEKI